MTTLIARIREWFSRPSIGSGPTPEVSGETSMSVVFHVSGPININVTQEIDLSALTAQLDALEAAITSETDQVTAAINTLSAQVADLQAKVDAGLATPEEQERLTSLTAKVAAIFNPPEPPPVDPGV